jgi:NAD+ kinase
MARLRDLKPRNAGFFAYHAPPDKAVLMRTAAEVLKDSGWDCLAVPALKGALGKGVQYVSPAQMAKRAGLLISLGGDGTLLGAAHLAAPQSKPVLGINLGGLGFMTAVTPARLEAELNSLLKGHCRIDDRRLVRAVVLRKGKKPVMLDALNDLSVGRIGPGRLVRMDASLDGRFLATLRADGLVFSSPTGSTAYSLSLGGPVVDPGAPVLLLTLVAPHTLSARPLALRESSVLELSLSGGGLDIAADGKHHVRLHAGDRVRFQRSPFHVGLVFPPSHDPWAVLRNKLGWQGHRQSPGGSDRA